MFENLKKTDHDHKNNIYFNVATHKIFRSDSSLGTLQDIIWLSHNNNIVNKVSLEENHWHSIILVILAVQQNSLHYLLNQCMAEKSYPQPHSEFRSVIMKT